ncbi:MAG: hypothetical protein WAS33_05615, partial [Candidatus Promineifilaceae bacterium]
PKTPFGMTTSGPFSLVNYTLLCLLAVIRHLVDDAHGLHADGADAGEQVEFTKVSGTCQVFKGSSG